MIDNYIIAKLASLAGAPIDKGAGVDLLKKLGDQVEQGEPLYRVHAEYQSDFNFAQDLSNKHTGYQIGRPHEVSKHFLDL
jgi:thymidine phosphorylase